MTIGIALKEKGIIFYSDVESAFTENGQYHIVLYTWDRGRQIISFPEDEVEKVWKISFS